jgi:hypothetical protein
VWVWGDASGVEIPRFYLWMTLMASDGLSGGSGRFPAALDSHP